MKTTLRAAAVLAALTLTHTLSLGPARAEGLVLPRPSPSAKFTQTVGLTDITVEYSSPGVKGRTIFGGHEPWGELWRAGANAATKITFSKDVVVDKTPVPAGSYSFFAIPGKASWTLILNKNEKASTREYKKDLDVVRVEVKPVAIAKRERLAYLVADFTEDAANVDLEWETTRVSLPVKLSTGDQAQAAIKAMTDSAWGPYNQAASYLLDQKKELDRALELVDASIRLREHWQNVWTKAQILAEKGKKGEAKKLAEKAQELGKKAEYFWAADAVKKALAEWK